MQAGGVLWALGFRFVLSVFGVGATGLAWLAGMLTRPADQWDRE